MRLNKPTLSACCVSGSGDKDGDETGNVLGAQSTVIKMTVNFKWGESTQKK